MAWLTAHQPADAATLGDPLTNLAGSMASWVEAADDESWQLRRRVPTHLPGMLTRDEIVAGYCERTGLSVAAEQWRFYEVFSDFGEAVRMVASRVDRLVRQ